MRERSSRRMDVHIKAEIALNGKTYAGYVKNVSEKGLGYFIASSLPDPGMLAPLNTVEMRFQAPSGQTYDLRCKIIWFSKTLPHGNTLILGMKIIDPPETYKEWIKKLA
jgi:hypothetical protein